MTSHPDRRYTEPVGVALAWCFTCRRPTNHDYYKVVSAPTAKEPRVFGQRCTCQVCLSDCPRSHVETKDAMEKLEAATSLPIS